MTAPSFATMPGTPLLAARAVSKRFGGVPALHNGCLELQEGSVHALCGGNGAGKSTFLNILMGILQRDSGEIHIRGKEVHFNSPLDALRAQISIITQELSPIPGMTVAENIFLGREPRRWGVLVDYARLYQQADALLARLHFDIDSRTRMGWLSLAQTQLVEIAKAFSHDSRIIIMDEPTSAIGAHETFTLFKAIRSATAEGAAIIYVSHRLSEIFSIADHYTVFRDGGFVESGRVADIDRRHLVQQIVGRELAAPNWELRQKTNWELRQNTQQQLPQKTERELLKVQGLTRTGEFSNISLTVAAGEIVGIYGLMGSGRSEFLNCVYGITAPQHGEVLLRGRRVPAHSPHAALGMGLSLVTEDRKDTGLVLSASVASNISLSALPGLCTWSVLRRTAERALVAAMVQRMHIKVANTRNRVGTLSGGNQQKVVLARCMATEPVCLICDEPTRGIDEGSKREIHAFLINFARQGGAVLLVSSEAPEILELSDRIGIFKQGSLTHMVAGHTASQEELLHLAS
ncbi:MAG: sugar ABC transporter ATP-binding protein [Rhodoferax sp.]|nr:sugar ABC transporter ATP-binding protein [Rhodoferax sp.]